IISTRMLPLSLRAITAFLFALLVVMLRSGLVLGQQELGQKSNGDVDEFYGSYGDSIAIEVPPYHGMEPKLALDYSSTAGNGPFGVGWRLNGFSVIERASSPGRGTPRYKSSDIFLLDGEELVPCAAHKLPNGSAGSLSPSCSTAVAAYGSSAEFY